MNKGLNFAIVGCGRIAQRHAEHIQRLGRLVAVCDIVAGKAKQLAEKYNAACYHAVDDLLSRQKDIDVVSVCSPNGLHAEHAIKSLRAGFHVLCEKPMALTVQDCGEMINAAERANRRLFIVKQTASTRPWLPSNS